MQFLNFCQGCEVDHILATIPLKLLIIIIKTASNGYKDFCFFPCWIIDRRDKHKFDGGLESLARSKGLHKAHGGGKRRTYSEGFLRSAVSSSDLARCESRYYKSPRCYSSHFQSVHVLETFLDY